jgi:hypothetical protein
MPTQRFLKARIKKSWQLMSSWGYSGVQFKDTDIVKSENERILFRLAFLHTFGEG